MLKVVQNCFNFASKQKEGYIKKMETTKAFDAHSDRPEGFYFKQQPSIQDFFGCF
jgi:hypothetical protein